MFKNKRNETIGNLYNERNFVWRRGEQSFDGNIN